MCLLVGKLAVRPERWQPSGLHRRSNDETLTTQSVFSIGRPCVATPIVYGGSARRQGASWEGASSLTFPRSLSACPTIFPVLIRAGSFDRSAIGLLGWSIHPSVRPSVHPSIDSENPGGDRRGEQGGGFVADVHRVTASCGFALRSNAMAGGSVTHSFWGDGPQSKREPILGMGI